ncbi:hypothetical protein CR513_17243, partial [Mucuna pruriens]
MGLTLMSYVGVHMISISARSKSTMQNSGVIVVAEPTTRYKMCTITESMHFSTLKDKNPVTTSICYFGWVDSNIGVTYELGFTLIDLEKAGYKGESFIMAYHAKQIFYVIQRRRMYRSDKDQDISLDLINTPFLIHMPTFNDKNEVDDVHVTHRDHKKAFGKILLFDQVT